MSNTAAPDFLPSEPSPLATQQPITGHDSLAGRMGESGLVLNKPASGETLDSSSAHVGTAQQGSDPSPFTPQAPSSSVTGLTDKTAASSSSKTSEGITPSSSGLKTPGGVVKSEDHVESLVASMGGIALAAPAAAYEKLSGHAATAAAQARKEADARGLTDLAKGVQAQLSTAAAHPVVTSLGQQVSGAAAVAKDRLTTSDPNAPPLSATLNQYAHAAAEQANLLASKVGLTSSSAHPATAHSSTTTTTDRAQATGASISQTAQSYLQSATATVQSTVHNASEAVQHTVHSLTDRVGLTSPATHTSATTSHSSPSTGNTTQSVKSTTSNVADEVNAQANTMTEKTTETANDYAKKSQQIAADVSNKVSSQTSSTNTSSSSPQATFGTAATNSHNFGDSVNSGTSSGLGSLPSNNSAAPQSAFGTASSNSSNFGESARGTSTGVGALPSLNPSEPASNSSRHASGVTPLDDYERQLQGSTPAAGSYSTPGSGAAYGEGVIGSGKAGQTAL